MQRLVVESVLQRSHQAPDRAGIASSGIETELSLVGQPGQGEGKACPILQGYDPL